MRATTVVLTLIGSALIGAGLWWADGTGWLHIPFVGHRETPATEGSSDGRHVLYYRNPMGEPDTSPVPKKDSMGMDYIPVYASEAPPPVTEQSSKRRPLYYRNPMGLADTSPMPKKDSMGMDYIPVYADEAEAPGMVHLNLDKVQRLGVRTEAAARRVLNEAVVVPGTVTADERAQSVVGLKFKAWITKLHVATTGAKVKAGEPLFDIHSPFLLQQETALSIALRAEKASQELGGVYARANERSAATARARLGLYEVPEREIERLIRTGEPSGHITWTAKRGGTVLEKPVVEGMQADEGAVLYRLADLSNIWVIAEAPERTLTVAGVGAAAHISLNAYPGKVFEGKVTFVYPEVAMTTRTVKLRIELDNHLGLLMPGMFASVALSAAPGAPVLSVPESALIDSGQRQIVLVARGEGLFEPRAVTAGRHAGSLVEIASGLKEGENVVTSATFLIDAESNLRAALQSFTAGDGARKDASQ